MKPLILVAALLSALWTPSARAATCTLQGRISIESLDSMYCDSTKLSTCGSWNEVNLNVGDRPLAYMRLGVYSGGLLVATAATNTLGNYTATWTQLGACTQTVTLNMYFARVVESDVNLPFPRLRFGLTDFAGVSWVTWKTKALAGTITTLNQIFPRTASASPPLPTKLANIYYTANSAVTEMITWHSSIDKTLSEPYFPWLKIEYDPGAMVQPNSNFQRNAWLIALSASAYNTGAAIRHELGHLVNATLMRFGDSDTCLSYRLGGDTFGTHGFDTCEWGQAAFEEGIASFFGVRSATRGDMDAWDCSCANNANQSVCSIVAANPTTLSTTYPDRVVRCTNPGDNSGFFFGIGDKYAERRDRCIRVQAGSAGGCRTCDYSTGCIACPDSNGDGKCDNYQVWGWRNEYNSARFLWDVIDYNDEGGDDTTETISSLSALLFTKYCRLGEGFGVDGSCNEPNRILSIYCSPLDDNFSVPVTPMQGTRDSDNPWDLGDLVPGSQSDERVLNCVEGATD